jgi:DNA-binding NtrC family response regulator
MGAAQQGTLLIREVGELDAVAQNLLLEVLKHKRFTPVGALQSQVADVRVIATSCRDLRAEVQNGRFSAELYYRLSSISCQTVPLRDRVEDILPIARQIMARLSVEKGLAIPSLSPAALALLETYDWPGNVNELEQALEAAILSSLVRESETMVLEIDDFPGVMEAVETPPEFSVAAAEELVAEPVNAFEAIPPLPGVTSRWISLQQLEAQHLRATLHHCRYHLPTAARLLGLSLADLRSRIQRHGVRLPLQPIGLPGVRTLPDNLEK